MKKYFIKDKEVKLGDVVTFETTENLGDCVIYKKMQYTLTEETLKKLVKDGKITVKEGMSSEDLRNSAIAKVARKMKRTEQEAKNFINTLFNLNPSCAFSLLLKEMAVILDKQYIDHIDSVPRVYIFNSVTGKKQLFVGHNHCKTFAAFRTKEDIDLAISALEGWVKYIYGE